MAVSRACCVSSGRGPCDGLFDRPEESTECGVSGCYRGTSQRRPRPTTAVKFMKKYMYIDLHIFG